MKQFVKEWRKTFLLLVVIVTLGLGIRIAKVVIGQQPVFADEAIYVRWSQVMKAEPTLRFLPLSDGKQPLYMWMLMFTLQPDLDPLIVGRLLSVALSMATLIGVFSLTYLLVKSKGAALVASLIYAITPIAVFFDSMALVDATLSAFGVWTLILMIITVRTKRLDFAMITGFALGGALLTKSPGLYFVILLPSVWILADWSKSETKFSDLAKLFALSAVTVVIAYGMYNILRLGPNFHLVASRNLDYVYPLSHLWQNPLDPFSVHANDAMKGFWTLGPGILVFVFVLGLIFGRYKHTKETLVLALWLFLPLVANLMYAKSFTVRYILFIIPFAVVIASMVALIKKRLKVVGLLVGLYGVSALLINYLLIFDIQAANLPANERSGYLEEWTAGYGIKEAADYIVNYHQENPAEKIVVGTEGYFGTLPDGLQMYLNDYKDIIVIGVGIDLEDVPKSLRESQESGNATFLVINSTRFLADYQDLNLNLLAAYPKALRKPNTREFNLYGPRENLYLFKVEEISKEGVDNQI